MSGGSFHYLCRAMDLNDLTDGKIDDLQDMAETLARLGYAPDAAAETHDLLADIRATQVRTETAIERLSGVWKAVEWWHSGDRDEGDVHDALATYRGITPARCCECGSTRVAYRNVYDRPFCWPCADGQPHPVDPMGATNE